MAEVKLGDRVRDKITGYEGIVVGIHKWLNGSTSVSVQATGLNEDGKPVERQSFDEPQVQLVTSAA